MKRKSFVLFALATSFVFSRVFMGALMQSHADEAKRLKVYCSNFPSYDFAKHVAGDVADVELLLKPGAESHAFEPTPEDMKNILAGDLLLCAGGENEQWIDQLALRSNLEKPIQVYRMTEMVETLDEEIVEGMDETEHEHHHHHHHHEEAEHDHEHEVDEHVWVSPKNAEVIVARIAERMAELDPSHASEFEANAKAYQKEIHALDQKFEDLVSRAKIKTLLVGDRFPLRYFVEAYGLKYYAAFPGCSTQTECSAQTLAYLVEKAKVESLPVVLHMELNEGRIAQAIADASGVKVLEFNSCHNVSREEFEAGESYVSLMERNLPVLEEALACE
ncbi:MAG: metal ABC transporter substrate-binding protein [Eubacteriales bacterium]|nr:metal ABC transporter substrate-binding protein [Eubacteriales bacterium]